jgi:hypothetical protein
MSHPTPEKLLQIGLGFWASKVLLSAVEMEVFTELAKHPEDLPALQGRLGLHPRAARDFFDALVALGFLRREDGIYHNNPDTDLFLDKKKPSYLGGLLEMANARLYGHWSHLTEALRTGEKQNEARHGGPDFFASLYAEPARLKGFLRAMSGLSRPSNIAIATRFAWAPYETYADLGTAQGDLAVQIALANPHLKGIGFDLPEVEPLFEEYVNQNKLSNRVSFVPGSFFKDDFPKADVFTMGHVLHDWDLNQKKALLRKAYAALPPGGAVIIYEAIIDDERKTNSFGLLMSLNMLIETEGGFDYTGADCVGWLKEAGFRQTRVERLVGPDSMVVGIK